MTHPLMTAPITFQSRSAGMRIDSRTPAVTLVNQPSRTPPGNAASGARIEAVNSSVTTSIAALTARASDNGIQVRAESGEQRRQQKDEGL